MSVGRLCDLWKEPGEQFPPIFARYAKLSG